MLDFINRVRARIRGFKTILLNVLAAVAALAVELVAYAMGVDWREIVPAEYVPYIVVGLGVANILLRFITKVPTPAASLMWRPPK